MRNTLPPLEGGYEHAVLSANSGTHLIVFPRLADLPHQLGRVVEVDQVADKTIMTSRYISLLKECEPSVGAAAINGNP